MIAVLHSLHREPRQVFTDATLKVQGDVLIITDMPRKMTKEAEGKVELETHYVMDAIKAVDYMRPTMIVT